MLSITFSQIWGFVDKRVITVHKKAEEMGWKQNVTECQHARLAERANPVPSRASGSWMEQKERIFMLQWANQ